MDTNTAVVGGAVLSPFLLAIPGGVIILLVVLFFVLRARKKNKKALEQGKVV